MVEWDGLENRCTGNRTVGSNPTLSANIAFLGLCDLCEQPAPFQNKSNEAYLECHHIIWLAQGGEDTIANTVALCPNCHRKMHVLNATADKRTLAKRAIGHTEQD